MAGKPPPARLDTIRATVREVWAAVWRDDVPFYAAGIAFHSLFSIFSLLFFLSLGFGLLGVDPQRLHGALNYSGELAPEKASEFLDTVLTIVNRPVPTALVPVALLFTLWTASNVIQALIHALNRIYHLRESQRQAWKTRLMALGVVFLSALFMMLGFVLLVFGEDLSGGLVNLEPLRSKLLAFALAGRQPLSILAVFAGAWVLYWLAPEFRHAHRTTVPGALAFTLAWIVATIGFNIYLREFAVYDKVYGPLATVVVVLVWVYLSAFLCLVGGEVNAAIHRLRVSRSSG